MYVSYYLDVSSGATIVLVGFALFSIVFALTGRRGLQRVSGLDDHGTPKVTPLVLPADAQERPRHVVGIPTADSVDLRS